VEQRVAKFSIVMTHELECHRQYFDPLLGVKLSSLGVARQSDPCGVRLSQNENVLGLNHYLGGWCGSQCHIVYMEWWTNHQSTVMSYSISGVSDSI
jgi:hypothetical protein